MENSSIMEAYGNLPKADLSTNKIIAPVMIGGGSAAPLAPVASSPVVDDVVKAIPTGRRFDSAGNLITGAETDAPQADSAKQSPADQRQYEFPLDIHNKVMQFHDAWNDRFDRKIHQIASQIPITEDRNSFIEMAKAQKKNKLDSFLNKQQSISTYDPDSVKLLTAEAIKDNTRYGSSAADLRQILSILDKKKPENMSQSEWDAINSAEFLLRAKQVNVAMTGTPDAVSSEEAKRNAPWVSDKYIEFFNLFKRGKSALEPNQIDKTRRTVANLYNDNITKRNISHNTLARATNPEYAGKIIPANDFSPEVYGDVVPTVMPITRKNPNPSYNFQNTGAKTRTFVLGPNGLMENP